MAEGWLRHYCQDIGLAAEVFSAGTEKTGVKPDAITVMAEVGIDLGSHYSKTIEELPDPWNFDVVMTVCDSANERCPLYPAKTTRLHVAFPDPSGKSIEAWREVRDAIGETCNKLVTALSTGQTLVEALLKAEVGVQL
jgi:arsenate reductase